MQFLEKLHSIESEVPLVMGIVNVTPDSFSDGGEFMSLDAIRFRVQKMVLAGADLVDIGGESTRPGAEVVSLQQELDRVLPAIELIKSEFDIAISVDTYKPEVMQQVVNMGVDLINDVNALQAPGAEAIIAQAGVAVCLMHKQGNPENMQQSPQYRNVFDEVSSFLFKRAEQCVESGILKSSILIDPGFGFGKTLQHNVELFERLDELTQQYYPVLVGVSRKKMIGELLGDLPVEKRMVGSVSAAMLASLKGARVIRVHDVEETIQALKVMHSLL